MLVHVSPSSCSPKKCFRASSLNALASRPVENVKESWSELSELSAPKERIQTQTQGVTCAIQWAVKALEFHAEIGHMLLSWILFVLVIIKYL
jgi:hypothetical protein